MPLSTPLPQEFYRDEFATNILDAQLQPDTEYVHDRVFGTVPTDTISGLYHKYTQDAWTKSEAALRAPGAPAPFTEWHMTQDRFVCQIIHLAARVTDDIKAQTRAPIDLVSATTQLLTRKIKLKKEQMFFQTFLRENMWTGFRPNGLPIDFDCSQLQGQGGWSRGPWNADNSNPELDMSFVQENNYSGTGLLAKTLLVARDVWTALKHHVLIRDDIKYTQNPSILTASNGNTAENLVAQALGVDEIIPMSAIANTSQDGQPSNIGFMVRNCALLVYKTQAPGILTTSAAYQFSYSGDPNVGGLAGSVRSWPEPATRSTVYEASAGFAFKMVASNCGVFFKNVLAE